MELSDVIPTPDAAPSIRRARVISVSGRNLTVDMGGGITIPSLDSCNPLPDQWVYIVGEGSSMMAVGAVAGAYRQAALTVTASTTATVTGILNGVSTVVSKMGAYATTPGDVLALLWAADGSKVWAAGPGGIPYVPPPTGGGGTGGGGGVTTGTSSYPATYGGWYRDGRWNGGDILALGVDLNSSGFFYGYGRFRELQGRTITGFRVNLARKSGSSAPKAIYGHPSASPSGTLTNAYSAGSYGANGWTNLPIGLANYLIGGSGTGGLSFVSGAGTWRGIPYGTLQFDWRK